MGVCIFASHAAHNPIVGFLPFVIIWTSFFGTSRLFGRTIPGVGVAVLVGIVCNLLAQTADFPAYEKKLVEAGEMMKWNGLAVIDFSYIGVAAKDYAALVFALACTNFLGTYGCNVSARLAGDNYSPM